MTARRRTLSAIGGALLLGLVTTAVPASAAGNALTIRFDSGIDASALGGGLADSVDFGVAQAGGGSLTRAAAWNGDLSAIRTPKFDASADGARAVVQVTNKDRDVLSPGDGALTFGADLALDEVSSAPGSADNGDNVVQRGLFGGNQYKIQADHDVASCRVAGSAGAVIVFSSQRMTPGAWYKVRCHREGDTVTLSVWSYQGDGTRQVESVDSASGPIGSVDIPAEVPLTVGGKANDNSSLTASESDQFNGTLARVVVRFGS